MYIEIPSQLLSGLHQQKSGGEPWLQGKQDVAASGCPHPLPTAVPPSAQ